MLIFLSLLFVFLRVPSLFEPYWYGDEGIYLTLGQAIRSGLTLYSQIHDNKPPTLYYLAALSHTVFGFRLLLSLVLVPTIYFFYRLCHQLFSKPVSILLTAVFLILSSLPFIEGNIANAEIFMLLPTILAVLFLFQKKYFLFGLLLGLAFTIKVPVIFEYFIFLFWLVFFNHLKISQAVRSAFQSLVGFIIPIGLFFVYFWLKSATPDFLHGALMQNFGYLSSWSTGSHQSSLTQSGLFLRLIYWAVFSLIILLLYWRKFISPKISFILLWFSATVFAALLSSRPYPHYLIQILPPFCLLAGFLFLPRLKLIFLASTLFLLFVIKHFNFYFYPNLSYYQNFYSKVLSGQPLSSTYPYFGQSVPLTYSLAQAIKQHSQPDQKIFIWGDHPYLYPLSNRLPASKYTVAYHIVDFKVHQQVIDQLVSQPPQLIIYFPMDNRPFPQLDNLISSRYQLAQVVGPAYIFSLK